MRHEKVSNQAGSGVTDRSKGFYNSVDQCRAWDMARQERAHYFTALLQRLRRHKRPVTQDEPAAVHYVHGSARPHAS